jgi:phosphatidylserine/phosphatidylglycerophosphate/cardiolipin synthase-like enzyme
VVGAAQQRPAGIEIHEYQPTMLHQKTMIVDGA